VFPEAAWVAVRVRVDFEAGWTRMLWLSYMLLIRMPSLEERVALLTREGGTSLPQAWPGDPCHAEIIEAAAAQELDRLVVAMAEQISRL
jgi:hypothetical protein